MRDHSEQETLLGHVPSQASNSSFASTNNSRLISPPEEALQSLCKQILKSRFFKGYYGERRFVEAINGYRDIVSLQQGERELEKLLLDVRSKLRMFYQKDDMWIGVTSGKLGSSVTTLSGLETCIWTELDNLAFGRYWFTVKTVRFREGEILLKLKKVRAVDGEDTKMPRAPRITTKIIVKSGGTPEFPKDGGRNQIDMQDFINILQHWITSIKHTVYDFMSNDLSKENLKSFIKFVGLLLITVISSLVVGIKYLGVFTLRFMFELSRFTHVVTPLLIKVIDTIHKIVVGFYLLLAVIWKDAVVKRERRNPNVDFRTLEYNRPVYKSIQYNNKRESFKTAQ